MVKPQIAQPAVTLHILKTFGIHTSKRLGQNFLIDPNIVDGIVSAADLKAEDRVLEIGPGIGTLTQGLAETGTEVVAIELDRRLIDVLGKTLDGYTNVRVVHGDILKLDISREIAGPYKVVANLPYYITTPIIMGMLEQRLPITALVTMVQREVALRMVAAPGGKDYGALSVAVQWYTQPEIMFAVPPTSFIPAPAVESAVIRCTVRQQPPVEVADEKCFFRVVKASFAQRRKTLANSLKAAGLEASLVKEILSYTGIDGMRRGETLTIAEFAAIANCWTGVKNKSVKIE
jgi:16S rRNA (adenine1518-N6/adenine1519-N6)-dimethyltransferase